jgi:hypothetical protein
VVSVSKPEGKSILVRHAAHYIKVTVAPTILLMIFIIGILLFSSLILLVWRIWRHPKEKFAIVSVFILSSSLIFILFSARPIRLKDDLMSYGRQMNKGPAPDAPRTLNPDAMDLIKVEHQKAIDEIKLRIEQEDTWFHYKFLFVGGLITMFLAYVGFGKSGKFKARERLYEIIESRSTCAVLALATVVALAIDIHIRNNILVVQQLALWIANYVEPAFLRNSEGFLGWERFLRSSESGEGMHSDDLYGFIFYPHLHFLTWIIYVLYLGSFLNLAFSSSRGENKRDKEEAEQAYVVAGISCALVNVSLGAFTVTAHYAPSAFEYKILPIEGCWEGGPRAMLYFCIPWLIITAINVRYLKHPLPERANTPLPERKVNPEKR